MSFTSTTTMTTRAGAISRSRKGGPGGPSAPTAEPAAAPAWFHVPGTFTLLWMAVSLPLVAWDTAYVLLRPFSMPGGALHWPLWVPYELYGKVDHMYGFKQWNLGNGFTAAQSVMNVVETVFYLVYLAMWYFYSEPVSTADGGKRWAVTGRAAAWAVLFGFSGAVMTVSKTVLYWLNEYFSGFDNIGQNTAAVLFFLWIIPNGAWIVVPSLTMIHDLGSEIVQVLTQASVRPVPVGEDKDE